MFRATRPSEDWLRRYLDSHARTALTYAAAGRSREPGAPRGDLGLERSGDLGRGPGVFEAAAQALAEWAPFDLPWLELHPAGAPVEVGTVVCTVTRKLGIWAVNACRVVYVERGPTGEGGRHFAFAYGTLPGHVERGEERFEVREDASGAVVVTIRSFSRAGSPLLWPAQPYVRRLQRRFLADATAAVRRAVDRACAAAPPGRPSEAAA